jgi:anti-anti-sigma factor
MSASPQKHLKMTDVNGVAAVDFLESGLIYAATMAEEISSELQKLLDEGHRKILLDFSSVQYLGSTMLAHLAKFVQRVQAAGGQLKITGLGPVLRDAFRIGRLESLFDIFDTKEAALKSFH